jgi:hypothetical protein
MLLALCLILITTASAKHVVVVLDTAVTDSQIPRVSEMKLALEQAYTKYTLPQDQHTLIAFGQKSAEIVFEREQNPGKIKEYIRNLEFTPGCADWSRGLQLVNEGLDADIVYLLVDENPCGQNPSAELYRLASAKVMVKIIGIGTEASSKWAPKMHSVHSYRYLLRHLPHSQRKRDVVVREVVDSLTAGEIVAIVIVCVILGLLLLISCGYAVRQRTYSTRVKRRRNRATEIV